MQKSQPHILVAEDEKGQAEVLQYTLKEAGFAVTVVGDGEAALENIQTKMPDLLILDWMMPKLSGLLVMRKIKQNNATKHLPIIMLTARGEESDKIQSFEDGVDDYMVKPYLPSELIARITSVLRRTRPDLTQETLKCGDLVMNLERKMVFRGDDVIDIGPTEFRLLRVLLERPGKVYSREQLLDRAWGSGIYVEDRTVDVAIRRLRRALNAGGKPDILRTVRGAGYALNDEIVS